MEPLQDSLQEGFDSRITVTGAVTGAVAEAVTGTVAEAVTGFVTGGVRLPHHRLEDADPSNERLNEPDIVGAVGVQAEPIGRLRGPAHYLLAAELYDVVPPDAHRRAGKGDNALAHLAHGIRREVTVPCRRRDATPGVNPSASGVNPSASGVNPSAKPGQSKRQAG